MPKEIKSLPQQGCACGALYKVMRIDSAVVAINRIDCSECGAPLDHSTSATVTLFKLLHPAAPAEDREPSRRGR